MGFIATAHLVDEDLPLAPTITRHPGVTIRYEYEAVVDGEPVCFVSVFGDEYAALENSMAADHTISNPTRVATFENRVIYRVSVDTDLEIVPDRCANAGLFILAIRSGERGWIVRVHLPDRDVLVDFRSYCRRNGVSFRVKQLYDSTASDDGTYFLTEQQREILLMAYYAGYYEIPRSVSQDYLADRLGISNSAVSQRMRRAITELIAATLENDLSPCEYE